MNTQRCPHCDLPYLDSEVIDNICPACLRNLAEDPPPESAHLSADAPTSPVSSLRRWQILAASLSVLSLSLGGIIFWLVNSRGLEEAPVDGPAEQAKPVSAEKLKTVQQKLKTARGQVQAAKENLKTTPVHFDTKRNKAQKQPKVLQQREKEVQEKLTRAQSIFHASEKRVVETKAWMAKSVEELKNADDFRGLVAKLGDPNGRVRSQAAHALSWLANKLQGPLPENFPIRQLIDACLCDPWKDTRVQCGHALNHVLSKSKNQKMLRDALAPLLDVLNHQQVETDRRRCAAGGLFAAVLRLERVDLLHAHVPHLLTSTFNDPDEGVREYAGRALQHTLQKLDDEPTLTIAAHGLAAQLTSEILRARSYSAVMLSVVIRKIRDRNTLKKLLSRISAATADPDKGVRDYAGRAKRHIQHVLKQRIE